MKPDDTRHQHPIVIPPRTEGSLADPRTAKAQEAAANIARAQIQQSYAQQPAQPVTTEQTYQSRAIEEIDSPYERTHEDSQTITPSTWQRYHSAWQDYYRKYYENYYMSEIDKTKRSLEATRAAQGSSSKTEREPEVYNKDEALYSLRTSLLAKIEERAKQVRKSRHFLPVAVALGVMLIFVFLQYNRTVVSAVTAYVAPGNVDPEYLNQRPGSNVAVTDDDRIIIPKVNINIPIVWNAIASDQNSLNRAMDNGAAWFNVQGASAKPGEKGNSVFSAHSSNDWLDGGDYKFAFAPLVKLKQGDLVYINYQGTRYTYAITHTQEVKPTQVDALRLGEDKPYITLITCVPLGTALNRLLVFADQVSPSPSDATEQTKEEVKSATSSQAMPRNSPSFIERVFGVN